MKLVIKISILIVLTILNFSCWFGSPDPKPSPSSTALIYYRNAQDKDLLDPSTLGHIDQSSITMAWLNPDGSKGTNFPIIFDNKYNPSLPFLPEGYCIQINPYGIKDNNGNSGIVVNNTANIFIHLNASTVDTLTFLYSASGLQKFLYNKMLISPPQNMSSYPPVFPVIIVK